MKIFKLYAMRPEFNCENTVRNQPSTSVSSRVK